MKISLRIPNPGWQRRALLAFELLENAKYMRNNKGESIPDCPAVLLIGTCVARGVQGLPSPALAPEKLLLKYIHEA